MCDLFLFSLHLHMFTRLSAINLEYRREESLNKLISSKSQRCLLWRVCDNWSEISSEFKTQNCILRHQFN